jgi:hypothetical protein
MMNSNPIILFCQAPADIPYLLTIYKKNKGNRDISIYVINVENMFRFLKELNLDVKQIIFIPYLLKSFKHVGPIIKERNRVNKLVNEHFLPVSNAVVYFFSRFEDWLTSSFIGAIANNKSNAIKYVDHYDVSAAVFKKRNFNIKALIIKVILWYITGHKFKIEILEKLPEFPIWEYNIETIPAVLDPIIFSTYCYHVSPLAKGPNVLFFVSPSIEALYEKKAYDELQFEIVSFLKNVGWTITAKGHPRLGMPENIKQLIDILIPEHIPAEFIGGKNIDLCLGIVTNAMTNFLKNTDVPTFSLLQLFEFKRAEMYEQYRTYLSQSSDNRIEYFDDFQNFQQKIQEIKC